MIRFLDDLLEFKVKVDPLLFEIFLLDIMFERLMLKLLRSSLMD